MNKTKELHEYSKYRSRASTFHSIQSQSCSTTIKKKKKATKKRRRFIFAKQKRK